MHTHTPLLSTRVPSDPGILARMGQIYNKEDDESQAFHYHLESYRHYPVSLDVISWLGVWYVKSELYEKAIHFFERASQVGDIPYLITLALLCPSPPTLRFASHHLEHFLVLRFLCRSNQTRSSGA